MKNLSWLLFDVVVGILAAGMLAPLTVTYLPVAYRGRLALAAVAVLSVVGVSLVRRAVGLGSVGRPR